LMSAAIFGGFFGSKIVHGQFQSLWGAKDECWMPAWFLGQGPDDEPYRLPPSKLLDVVGSAPARSVKEHHERIDPPGLEAGRGEQPVGHPLAALAHMDVRRERFGNCGPAA